MLLVDMDITNSMSPFAAATEKEGISVIQLHNRKQHHSERKYIWTQ